MPPILVTGATGLVGNNVVRQLLARGEQVRVLVRKTSDPRPLAGLDVDRRWGDVRDAESVRAATSGCRAVVHAAAMVQIGWTGLEEMRAINVTGTRHVAEAALSSGARLVHVSSVDALGVGTRGDPVNESSPYTPRTPCPYPITKREAELVVRELLQRGLDASIVNPSYMLGPWDWKPSSGRMLLELARKRPSFAPRAGMDYTHIGDVAAAILAALDRAPAGSQYLLTGEYHDYLTAWRIMADVCGMRRPFFSVGPVALYAAGWCGDIKARLTGREGDFNSAAIRLTREPHYYCHAKATRELDYQPRCLKEAATDAWAWFREHGYA
jgi:dihydroflavonol-4-reductase